MWIRSPFLQWCLSKVSFDASLMCITSDWASRCTVDDGAVEFTAGLESCLKLLRILFVHEKVKIDEMCCFAERAILKGKELEPLRWFCSVLNTMSDYVTHFDIVLLHLVLSYWPTRWGRCDIFSYWCFWNEAVNIVKSWFFYVSQFMHLLYWTSVTLFLCLFVSVSLCTFFMTVFILDTVCKLVPSLSLLICNCPSGTDSNNTAKTEKLSLYSDGVRQ